MQEKSNDKQTKYISTLSKLIIKHRKHTNKSIYLISAEASMPRSTWRDIEFCLRKDINLSTFCKIAEGLDIPPYELLKELTENLGKDFSFSDLDN